MGDKTVIKTSDPTSAYLGPKLWNNAIMNDVLYNSNSSPTGSPMMTGNQSPPSSPESFDIKPLIRPSIIVPVRRDVKIEPNLAAGSNEFLYVESKRARLDREKAERKRKLEVQLDFAPEDIALATVPGLDFDPKTRTFDMEE